MDAVFALDKHHTCRKDKKGVGYIEQGCIEDSLRAKDARHNRITDEPHVGKHKGKTYHALVVMILGYESGNPETKHQQDDVGEESHTYKRKNQRAVGHFVAHNRREHQERTSDVYYDGRQLFVELVAHIPQLTGGVTQYNHGEKHHHYF